MRASDSLIVTLADDQALAKSVPVKLYDSCAVGRPVVVAAPGEARRMAEEAGAALTVDPGDPHALAAAIRTVRDDSEVAARLSLTGPRFARLHLRERGVEVLEDLLVSVAESGLAQARISCPGSG